MRKRNTRTTNEASRPEFARARAVWIALLGVVPLSLFVQWSDMTVGGTMTAGPFPPLAACLQWAMLIGADTFIARLRGRNGALNRSERLVIFAVWATANMVAGRGLLHPLLASLTGPTYYARSGAVKTAVGQNLPSWLAITDARAARQFYEGYGMPVPWSVWKWPLLTWSLLLLPLLTANICLCALFERVWVRHERLAFPLVALPLEGFPPANAPDGQAFRSAFAIGLAFPLLLHGFGVAHAYAPAIPCVPFFNDLSLLAADPPWTALRPLYFNIYPLLIGLTFLAPADVTFSVWFFLVLNKLEMAFAAVSGWSEGATGGTQSTPPYIEEQSAGAFLALAALLTWNARAHLRRIARSALGLRGRGTRRGGSGTDTSDIEPNNVGLSSTSEHSEAEEADAKRLRPFFWGFVAGILGLLAWCVGTGLPLWFSALFFGFYFAVALVLSRLMAEGGVSWILAPILPDKLIFSLLGSASLAPVALTRLMLHVQHLRDTRQMLLPAAFEAGKLRDSSGMGLRRFYALLLGGVLIALVVGVASGLPLFYRYGALSLTPNSDGLMMSASVVPTSAVNQFGSRLLTPVKPSAAPASALAFGAALTWALFAARMRFLGWPLHPLGYALTGTLQLGYANKMLFSIAFGWLLKILTLRFGGQRGFRLLRGIALGLIVGDLLMGGILKLLDALLGPSGYAIF